MTTNTMHAHGTVEQIAAKAGASLPATVDRSWSCQSQGSAVWWERDKPGVPGVVEKHYVQSYTRAAAPDYTISAPMAETIAADELLRALPNMVAKPVANIVRAAIYKAGDLSVAALRSQNLKIETGGVLRGKIVDDTLVVTKASRACENEKARSVDIHIAKEDSGQVDGDEIIGCYHTHPSGDCLPSDTDKRAWRLSFDWNRKRGSSSPWLSLILGIQDDVNVDVSAWATDQAGTRRIPLTEATRS